MSMEGIQRNLVREILRECPPHLTPSKDFVAFIVDLLLLDPNWGITKKKFERKNIQNFVTLFINNLNNGIMDLPILRMQLSFESFLKNITLHTESRKEKLLNTLLPLKKVICNTQKPEHNHDKTNLKNKFVYYVTLLSGMGDPRNKKVFTEAAAALTSVFHESNMLEFTELRQKAKEKQLSDLAKLVSGVRLFNKDCHKGGVGIPNLHKLLNISIDKMREHLQQNVIYIAATLNSLTDAIKKSYKIQEKDQSHHLVRVKEITENTANQENDLLIMFHQSQVFTNKLIQELGAFTQRMNNTYDNFRAVLLEAHEKINSLIPVSIEVAYPIFLKLTDLWIQMQDQVIELSLLRSGLNSLNDTISAKLQKAPRSYTSLESTNIDSTQRKSSSLFVFSSESKKISILLRKSMADRKDLKFEFLGFCPWVLVETRGVLIPGIQHLGVVEYKNKYFVVSSQEAYDEFSKNPEYYIMQVLTLAREKPQLITFLNLKPDLVKVRNQYQLVEERKIVRKKRENGTQTHSSFEHIVPPNRNKSYNWNVWHYKREALSLLTTITNKTKSSQTVKIHSTNSMYIQTCSKTSSTTQTKIDNYTNTPKPSTFIAGLRGRKDKNQIVMDLTQREV